MSFKFSLVLISITILINIINSTFLKELENSEKIPIYLSIETDSDKNRISILNFILKNLNILSLKYPNNIQIEQDIYDVTKNLGENLHEPNSWHLTTYYIGQDERKMNSRFYKDFKENVQINLNILSFAYIPGQLISTPIFTDYDLIENSVPHMTLMFGGNAKAVDSNFLLKSVFKNNNYLNYLYLSRLLNDKDFTTDIEFRDFEIYFPDRTEVYKKVYFIKSEFYIEDIEGFTKINYDL